MHIISFFGEQLPPHLLGIFPAGFFLYVIPEAKIIAVVGPIFFFHIFGLRFSALVRFCFIEEDAVEAYVKVEAAGWTFVTS